MEDLEAIYASISGGSELLAWFGRVPSFHDAEVISVCLHRKGPSKLRIHVWNMTSDVDDRGYYILDRNAVVTFILESISDLQLYGFTQQNVIGGLDIKRSPEELASISASAPNPPPYDYEICLEDCYGLSGTIRCRNLRI